MTLTRLRQEMTMASDTHIRPFAENENRSDRDLDASDIATSGDELEVESPSIEPQPDPVVGANGIRMIIEDGWVAVEATGDDVVLNGWLLERP
jgi:hypothetical protein